MVKKPKILLARTNSSNEETFKITLGATENNIDIDPGLINWASIAIFKNAYSIFKKKSYKSKLLAAAFRCDLHWKEIVGGDVIISMPYEWWNRFNKSDV